jgi:hypothetical protein
MSPERFVKGESERTFCETATFDCVPLICSLKNPPPNVDGPLRDPARIAETQ